MNCSHDVRSMVILCDSVPFFLSSFMISKTHIVAQKPRGKELNAKVCGSGSASVTTTSFNSKMVTIFSSLIRMRTRSLVPRPKTTIIGLGSRLVYQAPPLRVDFFFGRGSRTGNLNDVICLSRSEKVAEFAQCVAPCRLKLSRLCQITHRK